MSWGSSILAGVLTAVVGAVVAGLIASLATDWYRVSSFEAGAAAFVAGFIFLGIVAGFLSGVIASRTIGAGPDATLLRTLGMSNAVLLGAAAIVGVAARLLADVPPKLDGEELLLAVELRWPEGDTASPKLLPGEPSIQLGSVSGSTMRASTRGPLWTEDARLVDGRWVAPGAVDIFTTRGKLTIHAILDSANVHAFLIPLRGRPGKADMQWTDWYPHAKPGSPALPNGFTYRYRVQKRSEPVRTEKVGPFDVVTIAAGFFDETMGDKTVLATSAEFIVSHGGHAVTVEDRGVDSTPNGKKLSRADGVAVIHGPRPALLVHFVGGDNSSGACYVVVDDGGQIRTTYVPRCTQADGEVLTSDPAAFRKGARRVPRGRINRVAFDTPGLYVVGSGVLDTRRLEVHPYSEPDRFSITPAVRPLGVSPDERSFVRFGSYYSADNQTAVAVADFVGNRSYLLDVDEARMRYATLDAIDPAWLMHHFEWQRGSEGTDSLVERKGFVPIPYHGRFAMPDSYWLEPAREALRDAIIELLVDDFKGERVPVETYAYHYPVKIDGKIINVAYGGTGNYVAISLPDGATDRALLDSIARHVDKALATGKYDALFGK